MLLPRARSKTRQRNFLLSIFLVVTSLLGACAGDSGAENEVDQNFDSFDPPPVSNLYSGPPASSNEAQNFQQFFWNPVTGQGNEERKCVNCHTPGLPNSAPSHFANFDDVNLAFSVAKFGVAANGNPLIDLETPENSEIVRRVAAGHNCWTGDLAFCRSQLISYISGWRDGATPTANVVQLTAPNLQDPAGSKDFPPTSLEFAATVWPVLNSQTDSPSHCQGCHSDTAPQALRQTPYFASDDVDLAYDQVKSKLDLANPADSRVVEKLRDEFHNCWSDCADDAAAMLAAIELFANPIPVTTIDPNFVTSKALGLFRDGIVAASGGRVEDDVIALYEFTLGQGNTVVDRSGVAPAANLVLSGDFEWLQAWGVQFRDGKAQASVANSSKLRDSLSATGEFSIEAWVAPANVTQEGPARIVSYSGGNNRNFMLGQTLYNYNFPLRTSETNAEGMPMLSTADADEDLQATLQHVVVTYDAVNGRRIYVNGQDTGDVDSVTGGTLSNWNENYALVLGSEVDGTNPWAGAIRLLAIHSRALDAESVTANFDAGVGQKYFLLFGISHLLNGTPDAFIVFEVSQFDNYAYLFSQPYFLSLESDFDPASLTPFPVQGLRIGINGKIATAGQTYATMDTVIDGVGYDPVTGQRLSNVGAVIALENGPDFDEFFLVFDRLGDNENVFLESEPPEPVFVGSGEAISDLAVRTFSEINHSFSQITGVPVQSVAATYNTVIQQLPSTEGLSGFLSSHQMGVTQLAIGYCDVLIDDASLRSAIGIDLPEIEGTDDANAKSVADWDSDFIDPMLEAALNTGLAQQPDSNGIKEIVHHLLFTDADSIAEIDAINDPDPHGLSRCNGGCPDGRTAQAAKAACAAILGSAGVTMH